MSRWPSAKGRRVLRALLKIGWTVKARKGSSHLQLVHPERGEYTWAFGDSEEIGPKMLVRIALPSTLASRLNICNSGSSRQRTVVL